MRASNSINSITLLLNIAMFMVFGTITITAQDKIEVAGKITATVIEKCNFDVGDKEGHIFHISKSEGFNTSMGKNGFMDGALVINNNFSDLVKGNGIHRGYIIFSKEGNSTVAQWEGKVTTVISDDTPYTTFEGTFNYINGTGEFQNIQGGGKYAGKYISANSYVVEWEGEYFIKE